MGGKLTLATAAEYRPGDDRVGNNLSYQEPQSECAALGTAVSPFSTLEAIARRGKREQRPCNNDVCEGPPAKDDQSVAGHGLVVVSEPNDRNGVDSRRSVFGEDPTSCLSVTGMRAITRTGGSWAGSRQMLSLGGRVPTLAAIIVEGKPKRGRTEQVPHRVALEETVRRADHTILIQDPDGERSCGRS